jgi:hypothetical protein
MNYGIEQEIQNEQKNIKNLLEKKDFLSNELINTANAPQKFQYQKEIDDIDAKIAISRAKITNLQKSKVETEQVQEKQPANLSPQTILFVAANPEDTKRLRIDKEFQIIQSEIQKGSSRHFFEFEIPKLAVTITDLMRVFNQKPQIIHFSGHGFQKGILISTEDNQSQLLPNQVLPLLFKNLQNFTRLVVLNSCYSDEQAKIISTFNIYVIGYKQTVDDGAAISFAKGLYVGLSEGKSIENAYNDGLIVLMTEYNALNWSIALWFNGEQINCYENNAET